MAHTNARHSREGPLLFDEGLTDVVYGRSDHRQRVALKHIPNRSLWLTREESARNRRPKDRGIEERLFDLVKLAFLIKLELHSLNICI